MKKNIKNKKVVKKQEIIKTRLLTFVDYDNETLLYSAELVEVLAKARETVEFDIFKRDFRAYPELAYKKPLKHKWVILQPGLQALEGSPYKGSIKILPRLKKVVAFNQWGKILRSFRYKEDSLIY